MTVTLSLANSQGSAAYVNDRVLVLCLVSMYIVYKYTKLLTGIESDGTEIIALHSP